jgi:hypothetical protein
MMQRICLMLYELKSDYINILPARYRSLVAHYGARRREDITPMKMRYAPATPRVLRTDAAMLRIER